MLANEALPSTVDTNTAFPPASIFTLIGPRPGAFQLLGFVE
jgi:hypothetical protein